MGDPINLQYTTIKDPVPDFIYEGLKPYSSQANTYRPQPEELIEKISNTQKIPKEMIYLTAGCDEAIHMFIHAYGEHTYAFTPTYIVYKDAVEFRKKFTEIYSIKNYKFEISTDKINNANLIFLANPNNPSGFTEKERVLDLVKNNVHAVVVVDEAYQKFADLSVINKVNNFKNMAVITSFSKNYGMAGNRIGYIVANPEIISVVRNKVQWSNVSYLSIGAAMIALDHEDYFRKMREDIKKRRELFMGFLKERGINLLPSKINAVVLKFPSEEKGTMFFDYLAENNIVVSHGNGNSNIGLDNSFVRIAIGNERQMELLKKVISNFKS